MDAGFELMWVGMATVFGFLGLLVGALNALAVLVPEESPASFDRGTEASDMDALRRKAVAAAVAWNEREGA